MATVTRYIVSALAKCIGFTRRHPLIALALVLFLCLLLWWWISGFFRALRPLGVTAGTAVEAAKEAPSLWTWPAPAVSAGLKVGDKLREWLNRVFK